MEYRQRKAELQLSCSHVQLGITGFSRLIAAAESPQNLPNFR
jgi:hypothetical protein